MQPFVIRQVERVSNQRRGHFGIKRFCRRKEAYTAASAGIAAFPSKRKSRMDRILNIGLEIRDLGRRERAANGAASPIPFVGRRREVEK
jgi:hypothetical protein